MIGGDGPFPRKPDPAGLRHLIAEAGVESSTTLMVGDSAIDWRTAHAASARSCTVRYGFGFDGFPVDDATDGDVFIDAPADLLGHL